MLEDVLGKLYTESTVERKSEFGVVNNDRVLLIDGLNTFIRSFLAVPTINHSGKHVGALVGFLRSLSSAIQIFRPTRCIIIFDGIDCSARRRGLYPEYKAQRKNKMRLNRYVSIDPMLGEDESFKNQLTRLEQYLNVLPLTFFMINYIEADDIIGYAVSSLLKNSSAITIYSADKDFIQLVSDQVSVYSPIKKKLYTPSLIKAEFGLTSKSYLTFRALCGDASDNISGIRGAGLKTLLKYFIDFENMSCDDLISYAKEMVIKKDKKKIYSTIIENVEKILLNQELMQLYDVGISGIQKHDIQMWVNKKPPVFEYHLFHRLFVADGLQAYNEYFLNKLKSSFGQIDYYSVI